MFNSLIQYYETPETRLAACGVPAETGLHETPLSQGCCPDVLTRSTGS